MKRKRRLKCLVCDKKCKELADTVTGEVPIFTFDGNGNKVRSKGWIAVVPACQSCFDRLGRPIEILRRPNEKDLCVFTKSTEPIVLQGSGPRD